MNHKGNGICNLLVKTRTPKTLPLCPDGPNWLDGGPAHDAWPPSAWQRAVAKLRLNSFDREGAMLRWRHVVVWPTLGPSAWIVFVDNTEWMWCNSGHIWGMVGQSRGNTPDVILNFDLLTRSGGVTVRDFIVNPDFRGRNLGSYSLKIMDDVARCVNAASISGHLSDRDKDHHQQLAHFYIRHG